MEELAAAAQMHTPNLFFLAAKGSMKQFLQAFALADSEAAGHLAHMNADGVALIQMLRYCRKVCRICSL